jgi:hypothetical protein
VQPIPVEATGDAAVPLPLRAPRRR